MQAQARICPTCKDDHSADVDCLQYAQSQVELLSRENAKLEAEREAMREVVEAARDARNFIRYIAGPALQEFGEGHHVRAANSRDDRLRDALARLDAATGGRGDG